MRYLVLLPLVFLVACAGGDGKPLSPRNQVFQAGVTLNGAQQLILTYVQQPRCTATVVVACSSQSVVDELKKVEGEAVAVYKQSRQALDAGLDPKVAALQDVMRRLTNVLVRRSLMR